MTATRLLTTDKIAIQLAITPATWRSYVSRGYAPPPDGHLGSTPYWRPSTISMWERRRPGQGAGGGRPRKDGQP